MRIDINLAALVLLGAVFMIAFRSLDRQDPLNKKFLNTSLIILLEILFETLTCIINRQPEHWLRPVSVFLHLCLFITAPVLAYFWYTFIYGWVMPESHVLPKKHVLLLAPILLNLIITALSPAYGLVFYIDSSDIYRRGSWFAVTAAITYFYLLYSLALILRQRNRIMRQEFIPLCVFGIFPLFGGLVQSLFYGVLLMWSSCAFSLVIIYNFLQQRMIHLDHLTGVWTRGSFDYYISQRSRQKLIKGFGAIFADLDDLKKINDENGHYEGDRAIKNAVRFIKGSLRKTDIVARMGGDEFVIILDCDSKEDLEKTVGRISSSFAEYNERSGKAYRLECSLGADVYSTEYSSIEQFLRHVDSLLYDDKKKKKSA